MRVANLLLPTDSLAEGYPKINVAIEQAEKSLVVADNALDTSNSALNIANTALNKSNSTQQQLDAIVINGDSSVEAAQARVAADGTTTYDTLKERLDIENQKVMSQLEGITNVRMFKCDDGEYVKGDGVHDDTTGIQHAIDSGRGLYFPNGIYIVSSPLKIHHNSINWRGEFWLNTVLKCVSPNITMIEGEIDGANDNLNYGTIQEMSLLGEGVARNQTSFDILGYICFLKHVDISNFKTAGKIAGVYVNLEDAYIHNNESGILLQIPEGQDSNYIMTMLRFYRCVFMLNSGTSITNKNGVDDYPTVISLVIDGCGFEQGGKAFDLDKNMNTIIQNSWFESNTYRPTLPKMNLITLNNRFEANQGIEYKTYAGGIWNYGAGGSTEVNETGFVKTKEYLFQLFNNANVVDNGILKLIENLKNNAHFLEVIENASRTAVARVGSTQSDLYDISYHIRIGADGSIQGHDYPGNVVITKDATGTYSITLSGELFKPIINVTVYNALSTDITKRIGFYVNVGNTIDPSNYNMFDLINKVTVRSYDMDTNALVDAKVCITLIHNRTN